MWVHAVEEEEESAVEELMAMNEFANVYSFDVQITNFPHNNHKVQIQSW